MLDGSVIDASVDEMSLFVDLDGACLLSGGIWMICCSLSILDQIG